MSNLARAEGLRVALFSGNYNYTRDGANNALNRLVRHLLDYGAQVRVYSPTSKTPAFPAEGELVSVPSFKIPGRGEYRVAIGLPVRIKTDVEAFRPNIFHLSAPDWLGTGAQRLARQLDVPIVASMHTRFETYFRYYGLGLLHRWAWRRQARFYVASDCVLAPNNASKAHLQSMGIAPDRIRIWGRGLDTEIFSESRADMQWRRSLGYSDSDLILLFFGRVVREKGTRLFADTVAQLRARGYQLRPLVVGDGPALPELKRLLGDAVFLGQLHGGQLGRAIASADILLNPSTTEAFGNVNLECMGAGLAVVSADVPSARTLIRDGENGILSEAKPNAFADAVEELIRAPWSATPIRKAAAQSAAKYTWPEANDAVVRAYRERLCS